MITVVNNLNEIPFNLFGVTDLVMIDLDNTLVNVRPKMSLKEDNSPDLLKNICAPVFGFTARRTGFPSKLSKISNQEWTASMLKELELQFTCISDAPLFVDNQYKDCKVHQQQKPYFISEGPMIYKGVIYCDNIDKGHILLAFLAHYNEEISNIIIIDDCMQNLLNIQTALNSIKNTTLQLKLYHYFNK